MLKNLQNSDTESFIYLLGPGSSALNFAKLHRATKLKFGRGEGFVDKFIKERCDKAKLYLSVLMTSLRRARNPESSQL